MIFFKGTSTRNMALPQQDIDIGDKWYLFKAIGIYLDIHGTVPPWAVDLIAEFNSKV